MAENLGVIVILGFIATVLTQFVLGIIGLSHAVPIFKDGPDCGVEMYVWLIVYGSVSCGAIVLGCLLSSTDENGTKTPNPLSQLASLFNFGWVIYGLTLIFNDDTFNELELCDARGSQIMRVITLISLSLWCIMTVLGCGSLVVVANS